MKKISIKCVKIKILWKGVGYGKRKKRAVYGIH
jgi:hypothetical protein